MRLFHLTSHTEALHIIAEGFAGADSPEPVCYLLLESIEAHAPIDPAVAVLEVDGDFAVQELGVGPSPTARAAHYRLFVATARELRRARVRLLNVRAMERPQDRQA